METIKIKYFSDKIEKLTYIDGKSDWIDLRAAEDVTLKQGEFKLIPLGVAVLQFSIVDANHLTVLSWLTTMYLF